MSDLAKVVEWFVGDDTGVSSKTIAAVMCGADLGKAWSLSHPLDPADLGRCLRLLERFPEWKARIGMMAGVSETWARLVVHWPELEATMRNEVGIDWSKGRSAPRTYDLMKRIMRGAR